MQRNPNADKWQLPTGYRDIGWQVGINNPDFMKCLEAKHKRRSFDNSTYLSRGTDVVSICDECKIVMHTDMSD